MPEDKKTSFVDFLSTFFSSLNSHDKRVGELYKTVVVQESRPACAGRGEKKSVNRDNALALIIEKYLPSKFDKGFDRDDNAHRSWRYAARDKKGNSSADEGRKLIKNYFRKNISSEDLVHEHIFPKYSLSKKPKDFGKLKWRTKAFVLQPLAVFVLLIIVSAFLAYSFPLAGDKVVRRIDSILFYPFVKNIDNENIVIPKRVAGKEQLSGFIKQNNLRLKSAFSGKENNFLITADDLFGRVAGAQEINVGTKIQKLSIGATEEIDKNVIISMLDTIVEKELEAARFIISVFE